MRTVKRIMAVAAGVGQSVAIAQTKGILPPVRDRRWAWFHLAIVVYFSFQFVGSLRDGNAWGVVGYGLFILVGISSLVRSLAPRGHRLTGVAGVVGMVAFGTVGILVAVRLTIEAVQASGGEKVAFVVGAVFSYLLCRADPDPRPVAGFS